MIITEVQRKWSPSNYTCTAFNVDDGDDNVANDIYDSDENGVVMRMSIDDQNDDNLFMITMRQLIYSKRMYRYLHCGVLWQNSLLVLHHQKLPMQTLSAQPA